MSINEAFDESVRYYDEWVRIALPSYDEIFSTAVSLLPFDPSTAIRVLDLGAGTGLFSHEVYRRFPQARFVLCDVAEKMLDVARSRFQGLTAQFSYRVSDYRDLDDQDSYDAVVSSLSIHHLEHAEKQKVFRAANAALRRGGVFINVDQARAPSPAMSGRYWSNWLETVRARGANEEQIAASIDRRTRYDRDATLHEQVTWLTEAGLTDVDCVYKHWFVAVFFGRKS